MCCSKGYSSGDCAAWQINKILPFLNMYIYIYIYSGPGSSVGIATDYGLDGPGSNPGGDKIFPPVQTGPEAHPAS